MLLRNTSSGLRPDAGDFASDITCAKAQISLRRNCVVSCSAKRKVPKRRPPRCRARCAYPVLPAWSRRLWNSARRNASVSAGLKQSSPTSPRPSELLGATQGPQLRSSSTAEPLQAVRGRRPVCLRRAVPNRAALLRDSREKLHDPGFRQLSPRCGPAPARENAAVPFSPRMQPALGSPREPGAI